MLSEKNIELLARVIDLSRVTTVGGGLKLQSWMALEEIMNICRVDGIMKAQADAARRQRQEETKAASEQFAEYANCSKAASVEGWKLVPKMASREMEIAGRERLSGMIGEHHAAAVWETMIAAAPQPPHQDARERIAALDKSKLIRTIGEFTPCTADDGVPCCEACHCSRLADRIIALQAKGAE